MNNIPSWILSARGPILLLGETGTGKSTFAKAIHDNICPLEPFIGVNLATLNDNLIEGELYGHLKGSFTGATKDKKGYFETVGKGTLFLDEIGELSWSSQKKLLLLLEEKIFFKLGCTKEKKFQGRVIAATNRNLLNMVKEKIFREDLYYRLNTFSYELEPIRNDKIKKRGLINYYFEKYRTIYKKEKLILNKACLKHLSDYDWPGNIREIKNCMEFMVNSAEEVSVTLSNLPKWIDIRKILSSTKLCGLKATDYLFAKSQFEEDFIREALTKNGGKINKTAREMGISKTTLIAKVRKYDIKSQVSKVFNAVSM